MRAASLRIETGQQVIVAAGLPVHTIVPFLVGSGFAQQTDVARPFDVKVGSREAHTKNIDRTSVLLAILR